MPKVFQKSGRGKIWQRNQQAKSQMANPAPAPVSIPIPAPAAVMVEKPAETQLLQISKTPTSNPPVLQPAVLVDSSQGYPRKDPVKCFLSHILLTLPGKAITKNFLIESILKSDEDKANKNNDNDDAYNQLFLHYIKQVQVILTEVFGIDIVAFDKYSSQGYSFEITKKSQSFMKRSQFLINEDINPLMTSQLSDLDLRKFTATMSSLFSIIGFIFLSNSMETGLTARTLYRYLQLMKINFFNFFHLNEDRFKDYLKKKLVGKHYLTIIPADTSLLHFPGDFCESKERYIWGFRAHYEVDKTALLLRWCFISKQDPKICKYQLEVIRNELTPESFANMYEAIDSRYYLQIPDENNA